MSNEHAFSGNVDGLDEVPEAIRPYMGCPDYVKNIDPHTHGYPSYMPRALERQQLDRSILACDATHAFLYGGAYTPPRADYTPGTRPLLEQIVAAVCKNCRGDAETAKALVRWRRANVQHIGVCGLGTEEEILLGGYSMCHDASRTLVILCQVAGLGARLVIGLNEKLGGGHTLTEICIDGQWAIFDPSPCMPFAFLEQPDGRLASCWDVHRDPSIPTRCKPEFAAPTAIERYGTYFADFRLVNYPVTVSTRYLAQRFVRMITAQKIIQNYDYTGHLNHTALSAYTDLDQTAAQWVAGTLQPTPKRYG